jgi:hypothetical protein
LPQYTDDFMPHLLMFTRAGGCPDQTLARRCLDEFRITPIELNISRHAGAAETLMELAGCLAVPTFVAADGDNQPIAPPRPMEPYRSVRNVDRGSIISEPTSDGLRAFLIRHGFLAT